MPNSILIRGARVLDANMYCSNSGQRTIDVTFRAAWTVPVCEHFGWQQEPNGFGNGSLEGKLAAISLKLEPSSKLLKDYSFEIPISSVHGFKHRAKTEEGTTTKRELEFIFTTTAPDAAQVLANYIEKCGPAEDAGQCKVAYSPEQQMEIGEEGAAEEAETPRRGRKKGAEAAQ